MWTVIFLLVLLIASYGAQCLLVKPSQRFLVLNCEDIPWEPISFFDMYKMNLALELGSLQNMGLQSESWTCCNVVLGEKIPDDVLEYDGIILTGSHYNCRPRDVYFEWYEGLMRLIRTIDEKGKPNLFGGCFGHNLIALALGGKIGFNPDKKYILQVENLKINNKFKELFSSENLGNSGNLLEYSVISTHEDSVLELPESATLLGSSENCKNHLFLAGKNNNILALQSHPEFNLQYAVMDRIWLGIVERRKLLSKDEISFSLKSFEGYDDADAKKLCGVISFFLHNGCCQA